MPSIAYNLHAMKEDLHRRNRETIGVPLSRTRTRCRKKNDIAASKPVARHFKPSFSIPLKHDNLRAILTPREHRKISNKNSSSNWVYSIHMRSMNASHSTNLSTNSYDRISTNGKALPHSYINLQHPTIPLFALTKY